MTAYSTPLTRPGAEPQLHCERLPGYAGVRAELVLLAGWSMDSSIWRGLLPGLRSLAHVTLLDLPGTGESASSAWTRRNILDEVLRVAPQRAIYAGWSLGGNIALALAQEAPQRVSGVLTLACNPCFVAREDWREAMDPESFREFQALVRRRGEACLQRFDALQSSGAREREALRWCRQSRAARPVPRDLDASLQVLADLDVRPELAQIRQPVRHLLGDSDQLVPSALANRLASLAPSHPVRVLDDCNHLLPLLDTDACVEELGALLAQLDLEPGVAPARRRDKQEVARSFSRAAPSYDSVAELQRRVGRTLLQKLPLKLSCDRVLDLGSGTGCFRDALQTRFPDAEYLGLDLAEGMARHARDRDDSGRARWLVGDAEDLPLAGASVDLVFSSLAIQWSEQLPLLFAEVARVLKPGGVFIFSTLGPDTLRELRAAWQAVDGAAHVNEFLPREDVEGALKKAVPGEYSLQSEAICLRYDRALDLLRELKALGAHNVNRGRSRGLTGRAHLQGMMDAYERFRSAQGLPATYDVLYGEARKANG